MNTDIHDPDHRWQTNLGAPNQLFHQRRLQRYPTRRGANFFALLEPTRTVGKANALHTRDPTTPRFVLLGKNDRFGKEKSDVCRHRKDPWADIRRQSSPQEPIQHRQLFEYQPS